jgi:hypothetical protein
MIVATILPYEFGETIHDRTFHTEESILWGVGDVLMFIDENGDN